MQHAYLFERKHNKVPSQHHFNMPLLNDLPSSSTEPKPTSSEPQCFTSSLCSPFCSQPPSEWGPSSICLQDILKAVAVLRKGSIICYPLGNIAGYKEYSCVELYIQSSHCAQLLRTLPSFKHAAPILLHLDDHWNTIVWFWAILLANGVPVLSSPFSIVDDHRLEQIRGLSKLLQSPICITTKDLLSVFGGTENLLKIHTTESLSLDEFQIGHPSPEISAAYPSYMGGQSLAMLMLTSGSTGNSKAVRLTHKQIISAITGKASVRPLPVDGPFMNWIDLNHVASLIEIHIQALWLGVDQIHVHAADIVSTPSVFLDLLSKHRVCRTFAPNFFLGALISSTKSKLSPPLGERPWDLSNLQIVASGGEANDVTTCVAVSALFQNYGARPDAITPGFGMTETCAGAIFNLTCPSYDVERGYAIASLGKCMEGIEMRVTIGSRLAAIDECGDLEVRGDVVFSGYHRNAEATANAFPWGDGWFRTGDRARINSDGNLCLIGRKEELVNINGIKIVISDVVSLLERALGGRVNRFVVFSSRVTHTDQITVCYIPTKWPHTAKEMDMVDALITQECLSGTFARPLVFSLRESSLSLLPISSLGKISPAKMSSLFAAGVFDQDVSLHKNHLKEYKDEKQRGALQSVATEAETLIMVDFARTLNIDHTAISPETQVFELGFTSMDLIRLKRHLDTRLGITLPIVTIMKNPTARLLAAALASQASRDGREETKDTEYDPVVTLKSGGSKAPLWLFHPGVGEVLVFIGLAQHLADEDRPIYALRARGFERGQTHFASITETVDTYIHAIQKHQKRGPYALAGYSYGAMLAFETAKKLSSMEIGTTGNSVRFLGSFNLPPHIKWRMRQLCWNMCLLHLTQFLGITTDEYVEEMEQNPQFSHKSRHDAVEQILLAADRERMEELGLEDAALARWADVAFSLQSMAVDYEPSGQADSIDVFHAIPLKLAAPSREVWIKEHLSKWRDFSRTEPRFHAVGGAHYTMIGPDNVVGFASKLQKALAARGV
ncbi:hypothetical protein H113_06611 [Trichophyton rubrum MR1459]|uniref:Carrier domain-containing protein n=3 Tax=Trichophyton rubrum TaxID=5551 RepID=F2SIT2_TRIRC|nr:uncharacterized protein TERG_01916 [Trichophyton rubrum CBS 118892]EZF12755.1 hypothetical protein H100_06574 [Trichophyton rubrum MR850]EZF39203.1 hypothetical protein H102_06541 [Trichophyton rubrum CBS 100081]EZF49850.1 hypothetical protein H103_06566 [Trichophyton rubrum CBS 288.86]EZF81900.1 hypothetical protein H110_06561 [Trichophyton rubrum MR1448]EZF92562.1 hypothetical protein H113_06611 [Trichophyton rubrum MR1459]EZG03748.1 hypothetical protein H106_06408 [Trichophyton rubrum C